MSRKLFYCVIALGLFWLVGSAMAADPGKGNILIEEWFTANTGQQVNNDVTTLHDFINAGNAPNRAYWTKVFDRPDGGEDYWGGRFRGYIYPPQTGDYTFWTCSDDDSEIWLSTDDTPANVKMICNVEGWMPYLAWDGTGGAPGTTFKSAAIKLTAGKRYYVETYFSDGTGGGFQTVGWGGPGIGAGPVIVDGKYLAPWIRTPEPMFMAKNPSPADGAIGVAAPLMTWEAGPSALWHDVYFGTDPNPPLVGRQMFALYYHLAGLEPGKTYYWKVDEIEADGVTMYKGPTWSFVAQAVTAYYPSPTDEAGSVSPNLTLTWQPGLNATKHQLYLSDSLADVTAGAAEADKGTLTETTYTPTDLQGATTYYWRVDEIAADGSRKAGPVWSFTTFILVDDFESYTDDLEAQSTIFDTWVDGFTDGLSGSTVGNFQAPFAERTIVHGGLQSMPMDYDNTKAPFLSEATQEFAPLQDWTVNGVTDLSLWARGYPAAASVAVTEAAGKITLTGDGADIWNNSDEFTYAYKTINGDGSLVARVVSIGPGSNTWAKAGVMVRDSLDGGSTHAMTVMTANSDGTAGNGSSFQWRPVADAASLNSDSTIVVAPPYWVKIERAGDNLSGSISVDGKTWRPLGIPQTLAMTDPVYIGLCVTSHASGEERTFQFDSISSTGGVTGQWQGVVIDSPRYNSAQPLYVTVEDSAGKKATASNADLVTAAAWTEWKVPLSSLTGVNLAKVKKLVVGVGDKSAPAADGAGRVYVDDITVNKP